MGRFDGRVAIVTGGASGIGAATMRRLAAEGATVVCADIDDAKGTHLVAELSAAGATAAFQHCDVGELAQLEHVVAFARQEFGGLDVIHNNAIWSSGGWVHEIDPDGWDRSLRIMLTAVFYGCRAAIPAFLERGRGAIVNTASVEAFGGEMNAAPYTTAKAGVVNLTRQVAIEYGRAGIRCNAIAPGVVDTPLLQAMLDGQRPLPGRDRRPARPRPHHRPRRDRRGGRLPGERRRVGDHRHDDHRRRRAHGARQHRGRRVGLRRATPGASRCAGRVQRGPRAGGTRGTRRVGPSAGDRLAAKLADELLVLALALVGQAAAVHRDGLGQVLASSTKSSATDVVTEIDHRAEALVLEGVRRHRPGDGYVGEEGADVASRTGVAWIVDPLDGTTNYVYGLPAYAVSIGVVVDGRPTVGVVHDSARDEVFHAVAGRGAFLDGRPIVVSARADLATALVATGFGYDAGLRARQAALLPEVVPRVRDIRRSGSCAIDLCWTACGRVDAFYEHGPADWDVTAGLLIAEEAGARWRRGAAAPRLVLAATPGIYEDLAALVDPG